MMLVVAVDITCMRGIFMFHAPAGSFRYSQRIEMEASGGGFEA